MKAQTLLRDSWNFVKFCLVGGGAAILSVSSLFVAVDVMKAPYLPSFVCIFVAVSALGYWASRRFAFRETRVHTRTGFVRYFSATSASLLVNSMLMVLLVERAGLRPVLATMLLAAANAPVNYLIHKRLTFRLGRNQQ